MHWDISSWRVQWSCEAVNTIHHLVIEAVTLRYLLKKEIRKS